MAKTLNQNYAKNVKILEENLNRGMSASQAIQVIDNWRQQFERHNMFGDEEKKFINSALDKVANKTHMTVKFM